MPVVGIGTDIIDISRITNMKIDTRVRLAKRVLTLVEYQFYCDTKHPDRYLAKRWAGKEATAKALGTGIAKGVSFQHITIKSLASGQPILELSDRALEIAKSLNARHWHISLADEKLYATAFVTLS